MPPAPGLLGRRPAPRPPPCLERQRPEARPQSVQYGRATGYAGFRSRAAAAADGLCSLERER